MKRISILLLILALSLLSLCSCVGNEREDEKESTVNDTVQNLFDSVLGNETIPSVEQEEKTDSLPDVLLDNEPITEITERTKIGDKVIFGIYEQDNNLSNGAEPITWQVLDKKDGKLFLISENILDNIPYADVYMYADWNTSVARGWLMNSFDTIAFSDKEYNRIAAAQIKNNVYEKAPDDLTYGTSEDFEIRNLTDDEDEIRRGTFLLGKDEAEMYFMSDGERQAKGTEYAISRGLQVDSDGYSDWWLRNAHFNIVGTMMQSSADLIAQSGVIGSTGHRMLMEPLGIRPVVWVTIDENAVVDDQLNSEYEHDKAIENEEPSADIELPSLIETVKDYMNDEIGKDIVVDYINETAPLVVSNSQLLSAIPGELMHKVVIPKINSEKSGAVNLNEKMYSLCEKYYEHVQNGTQDIVIEVYYEYRYVNDLIGICLKTNYANVGAGWLDNENFLYYDVKNDSEITYQEYMGKLGLTADDIWDELVKNPEYQVDKDSIGTTIYDCIVDENSFLVSCESYGYSDKRLFTVEANLLQ